MPVAVQIEGAAELGQRMSDRQEMRVARVKTLLEATQLLEDEAKRRVPVRSGKLQKSIKGFVYSSGNKAYVRAGAKHAHLVEYGTHPHEILAGKLRKRGKARRALTLPGGILRASAEHPGARAQPYLHPALDENLDRVEAILEKHGRDLVVRIARTK